METKANRNALRIENRIATHYPCTTPGMLAADLRLSTATVKRHIRTLIEAGRIVVGWDGNNYELTTVAIRDRAMDERVKTRR